MQIWVITYADVQPECQGPGWDVSQSSGSFLEPVELGSLAPGARPGGEGRVLGTPATHPGERPSSVPRARTLGGHVLQTLQVPGGKLRPREGRDPAPCHPAVPLASPGSLLTGFATVPPFLFYKMGLITDKAVRRFES